MFKSSQQALSSQRQAIIRLIEKPNNDKLFISNQGPASLHISQKIEKTFFHFESVLFRLHVNSKSLGESRRFIADIETCDLEQSNVATDFEKAFDFLNHNFLIIALEHHGFGYDIIEQIKILIKNQESCVINGCHTAKYSRIERGSNLSLSFYSHLRNSFYFYQV